MSAEDVLNGVDSAVIDQHLWSQEVDDVLMRNAIPHSLGSVEMLTACGLEVDPSEGKAPDGVRVVGLSYVEEHAIIIEKRTTTTCVHCMRVRKTPARLGWWSRLRMRLRL